MKPMMPAVRASLEKNRFSRLPLACRVFEQSPNRLVAQHSVRKQLSEISVVNIGSLLAGVLADHDAPQSLLVAGEDQAKQPTLHSHLRHLAPLLRRSG